MNEMEPVARVDDYELVTEPALRQVVHEVRRERDALRAQLHATRAEREALRAQLDGLEAARQALHEELDTIKDSVGWRLLQRIHALKARVLPPGSKAERAFKRLALRLAGRADHR